MMLPRSIVKAAMVASLTVADSATGAVVSGDHNGSATLGTRIADLEASQDLSAKELGESAAERSDVDITDGVESDLGSRSAASHRGEVTSNRSDSASAAEIGADGSVNEWRPPTREESARIRADKSRRMRERRKKARAKIASIRPGDSSKLTRMTKDELDAATSRAKEEGMDKAEHQWVRRAWGNGNNLNNYEPYEHASLADPSQYYDKWQQAYRMLGGFIDCDHDKEDNSHDSGDNNGEGDGGCSRWMMWAAYIDPNYQGGEYDEYFGDDADGVLDCHSPDTEWELLGVYRQEFYQFIEQISKHLWAIDDYEYIVALAGLAYMTDEDCWAAGYDNSGNVLYAGVEPLEGGKFQISLYNDNQCLYPDTSSGMTFDDLGLASDMDLGSKDEGGDDDSYNSDAYQYWQDTQEYTLTNLNEVYEEFLYCTSCVDYPTYQDGYFIGDDGTDDDDLINQCWKFYSHDSFTCDADCIALGAQQGTITWLSYGGKSFGQMMENQYYAGNPEAEEGDAAASKPRANRMDRLKANLFVTFAGIVFVATFLAFAVARGAGNKRKRSGKSRRLLDESESRRARSKSRRKSGEDASARRSKSRGGERSKSRSRRETGDVGRSSSSHRRSRSGDYRPPSDTRRSQSRSRRSSSRRHLDDF